SERTGPPLEGPMAPNVPRGTPGGWKGGINAAGMEASIKPASTADQIKSLLVDNQKIKQQMRVAGEGVFSEEEVQQAEKRMQENADIIKELKGKLKGGKKE